MDYFNLGSKIRKQRIAQDLTQEELAEQVGVSTSFIGHLERGTRKGSLETIVSISNVLGLSIDYLLGGSLNLTPIGKVPKNLSVNQSIAFRNIVAAICENLGCWDGD